MDNLPVSEKDLRILSLVSLPEARGNPVVNGAIERVADAFIDARYNGAKSVTISLDEEESSIKDTKDLIMQGEMDIKEIPSVLSIKRLEEVIAGNVNVLRPLNQTELVDIIIFCASLIEECPDATKLMKTSKAILLLQKLEKDANAR